RPQRLRHAARNLGIAGINLAVMGLVFAAAAAGAAAWAERAHFGLLHRLAAPLWVELPLALLLFDAWMYLWHRANHALPFLWRFRRCGTAGSARSSSRPTCTGSTTRTGSRRPTRTSPASSPGGIAWGEASVSGPMSARPTTGSVSSTATDGRVSGACFGPLW